MPTWRCSKSEKTGSMKSRRSQSQYHWQGKENNKTYPKAKNKSAIVLLGKHRQNEKRPRRQKNVPVPFTGRPPNALNHQTPSHLILQFTPTSNYYTLNLVRIDAVVGFWSILSVSAGKSAPSKHCDSPITHISALAFISASASPDGTTYHIQNGRSNLRQPGAGHVRPPSA